MARALVMVLISGALLVADGAAAFADGFGWGHSRRRGSSPFAIDRGVSQGGRVRFRTRGCGGARGSSPFAISRGVHQGGRVRFRDGGGGYYGGASGCGCGGGYAVGTPWSVLRANLATSSAVLRYVHTRRYFFRRYPYLFVQGTPQDGEELTPEHYLHPGYDVAANPLSDAQRLHLAVWKLQLADYKGARETFGEVLASKPKQPEASWGRAICSVLGRDWKQAAADLARVAELGELRLDDKLLGDEVFGEAGALERVTKDVGVATRYGYGNGDAHLVAAWLHVTQGNGRLAEIHLKKARRWSPENAAVVSLLSQFERKSESAPVVSSPIPESPSPASATIASIREATTPRKALAPVLVASR